jgi:hypothetical protein
MSDYGERLARLETKIDTVLEFIKDWPNKCATNRAGLREGAEFAQRIKWVLSAAVRVAAGVLAIYGAAKAMGAV